MNRLATVFVLAHLAVTQAAFIGCVSTSVLSNGQGNHVYQQPAASRAQCENDANIGGSSQSFYQASTGTCYGYTYSINSGDMLDGVDAYGDCQSGGLQASWYDIPYFQGCFSSESFSTGAPTSTQNDYGPAYCFDDCAFGYVVTFQPSTGACKCYSPGSVVSGSFATCGQNTDYVFNAETASSNPSIMRKRAERLAASFAKRDAKALCPAGMTACMVSETDRTSFECIDTDTELESCGGCIGQDVASIASYQGNNCLETEGAILGGVTCAAGRCVAMACERGFSLVDGTCLDMW